MWKSQIRINDLYDIPPDGRAPHATYALLATAHLTPLPKAKLRKVPERYVSNRRNSVTLTVE